VKATGKETVIRGGVTVALGLPDTDLPVLQRAFRSEGETLTHVCSVASVPGHEEFVFVASVDEGSGDAIVWRATLNGRLVSSVKFYRGLAITVSNEETQALFAAEKASLLRQMQLRSFRTGTAPAPKPSPAPLQEPTNVEPNVPRAWRNTALPSELTILLLHPWVLPAVAVILTLAVFNPHRR
ncbi:MAG: hypothetical protein M3Q89_00040, partial [Verrucomicrobiota bacterium]|nr:hypothetical protein [Verrucomicrobiota bacterium]